MRLLLAEGVPLTYVAAQMGYANPTTTLRWYGRWIKGQGQRWVDVLDRPGSGGRRVVPERER